MIAPTQKRKVPMAYTGLNVGSDLSGVQGASASLQTLPQNQIQRVQPSDAGMPQVKGGQGISGAGIASGVGAAVSGVSEIAGHIKSLEVNRDWLLAEDNDKLAYGAQPKVGSAIGKSALSGAAAGAAVGSVIPGIGTVIGGVVGGVVGAAAGWIGGAKKARKYKRDMAARQLAKSQRKLVLSRQLFTEETYEDGGTIDVDYEDAPDNDTAVVLGGKLHSDGGNPIVDADTGEKMYETEREEMLFTSSQSAQMESQIAKFEQSGDEKYLIALGQLVQGIVLTKTKDNSGKYA